MWFNKSGKVFVAMPGVPHEMKHMMRHKVIPRLKDEFELPVIYHKIVRLAGIGESWLAEKIESWENALPGNIRLAYLPTYGDIKMRLTATGKELEVLKVQANEQVDQLLPLINDYVYGFDDETLERLIGRLLKEKNETLAIAESCTGGYISHKITSIAGSSDYFNGSIVPYQNEMKIRELGVRETTLIDHGAVSEETVIEMAQNVREKFSANIGLASSGIAGPGGGTEEKPVGTIWIAFADERGFISKKLQLTKDRSVNIRLSTVAALNMLHKRLVKND
jgi:nicotinamide-nucleotide amidase